MSFIENDSVIERLKPAAITAVTDREIWEHLLTPTVKGILGPVVRSHTPRWIETTKGVFPGDEVTNLNGHKLRDAAGVLRDDLLRYPYVHHLYRTENGAVVIKRDPQKVWVACWFGDVEKGKGELIFKAALRDRRHDGTSLANDCSLLDFSYSNPDYHRPLSNTLKSVELSIYGYMPGSRIVDGCGDEELDRFVANPNKFLSDPDRYLALFNRAMQTKRAPGQAMAPIPDVSRHALPGFEHLARKYGYDLIEMAASYYHVSRWATAGGYLFASPAQEDAVSRMGRGLDDIRQSGYPLTRTQQSWVVALQSLRPVLKIPPALRFEKGESSETLQWPQDNTSDRCLWMYKCLSEKAQGFKPDMVFADGAAGK